MYNKSLPPASATLVILTVLFQQMKIQLRIKMNVEPVCFPRSGRKGLTIFDIRRKSKNEQVLIMDETEYLTKNPKSGKNYNKIRKGYFRSQIKSYFIFYRINRKNDEIEIIRILHQRMDIETRLEE